MALSVAAKTSHRMYGTSSIPATGRMRVNSPPAMAASAAIAKIISVSAIRNSSGGIWRRMWPALPCASLTMLKLA